MGLSYACLLSTKLLGKGTWGTKKMGWGWGRGACVFIVWEEAHQRRQEEDRAVM